MRVLLNSSENAYEEDFEVAEILNLFFDDEDGMCFIFADEPAEFYYFPKVKTTKEEVSEICVKLFEKGAADLTKYGPYENVDDKLCVES